MQMSVLTGHRNLSSLRNREVRKGRPYGWKELSKDMQGWLRGYKREFDEFSDQEQRTTALAKQSEQHIADK